jgi:hypothetical protein
MNLQESIYRIRQIIEVSNPTKTFSFVMDGSQETHQYQVVNVSDSTKSVPVDKTNPRGEKKTFNTKVIELKWMNPPANITNPEGITIIQVCGDNVIKTPRGYSKLPDDFITYANQLC